MTEPKEVKSGTSVGPWSIEADHPRNSDLIIQNIAGLRLRSHIANKPAKDQKTGELMTNPDQSAYLGRLPEIPGQVLAVNPAKRTYSVTDPLHGNKALCDRIKRAMDVIHEVRSKTEIGGVPRQVGTLDSTR